MSWPRQIGALPDIISSLEPLNQVIGKFISRLFRRSLVHLVASCAVERDDAADADARTRTARVPTSVSSLFLQRYIIVVVDELLLFCVCVLRSRELTGEVTTTHKLCDRF